MVETAINQQYSKVLEAANCMMTKGTDKITGCTCGDLVADKARYHRAKRCYSSYANHKNIESTLELTRQKQEHASII